MNLHVKMTPTVFTKNNTRPVSTYKIHTQYKTSKLIAYYCPKGTIIYFTKTSTRRLKWQFSSLHYYIHCHVSLMEWTYHLLAASFCSSSSCCRSSSISQSFFFITESRFWIVLLLMSSLSVMLFASFISGTSIDWSSLAHGRSEGEADTRWPISWA